MKINKNPKFKYRETTILMNLLMKANYSNLCVILLCLGELFPKTFYKKTIGEWLETYVESAAMMRGAEDDGIHDQTLERFMDECKGFTREECDAIALRLAKQSTDSMMLKALSCKPAIKCLGENIQLALIQLHYDYGFGEERTKKLVNALKVARYIDPVAELEKKYDISSAEESSYQEVLELFRKPKLRIDKEDLEAIECKKAFEYVLTH